MSLRLPLGLLLVAIPACSSSPSPVDSGAAGSDAPRPGTDAPVVDVAVALDVSGASDVGDPADAGEATVAWTTEVEPVTITEDIALDYFYQYELYLVGDVFSYTLDLERCIHIAGMTESCETLPRDPLAFSSGIRWGIDPSMYAVGENHYRFTLTLRQGTTVVATDTIELVATVVGCTSCLGS